MIRAFVFTCLSGSLLLAGCASTKPMVPRGAEAYQNFPALTTAPALSEYKIGPYDVISISTYQEEGLSRENMKVDASGNIILPLIGPVQAAGHSAEDLSRIIASRFGERYLQNPQVTVVVNTAASQRVIVEGAVRDAGVYAIEGGTTLLQAIALASGTTEVASTEDVVIFRTINGQRMAGAFSLRDIRRGIAEDPQIKGNDVVVVGLSAGKQLYRDILAASPLVAGIFRPIATTAN
jgi:polysaccharide export outer membrane protein